MEIKSIKGTTSELNNLLKFYLAELNSDSYFSDYKDIIIAGADKYNLIIYENKTPFGFLSYNIALNEVNVSAIYIEPTKRDYGFEEILIKALQNKYHKEIDILVRKENNYLINILKSIGFITKATGAPKKLKSLFTLFFYERKRVPYTKVIINFDSLIDIKSKEEVACKRLLKLYGVKPNKLNMANILRTVENITHDYENGKITKEEFYKNKYQRYFKYYGITVDPLLCYRIYNSSRTFYAKGAKAFMSVIGKRKHIIIMTTLEEDDYKQLRSSLKIKNISKAYFFDEINYLAVNKVIKEQRYRNIEEFCYIDSNLIDYEIERCNIDTYFIGSSYLSQTDYMFYNNYLSLDKIIRTIRKKG